MANHKCCLKILDGGLASTLESCGYKVDGDPLWSAKLLVTKPKNIYEVHCKFLEAGSDILITASYQASIEGFHKYEGLIKDHSLQIIRNSVQIAKDAVISKNNGKEILIAGSVGPFGACQADGSEYNGLYVNNMSRAKLKEWHKPRIGALIEANVDLLAIETIPALDEALAILELIKDYPSMKAWVSFTCKNGQETSYGDQFREVVRLCNEINSNQIFAIGINCTDPTYITSLLTEAAEGLSLSVPRIVYPNSGEIWNSEKRKWEGTTGCFMDIVEKELDTWIQLGVRFIGGCCRILPSDIEALSKMIKEN